MWGCEKLGKGLNVWVRMKCSYPPSFCPILPSSPAKCNARCMGTRRIFSRGGQWEGLKDGSFPVGSKGIGQNPSGSLEAKLPEADNILSK